MTSITTLRTVEKRQDFCAKGSFFVDCTDPFGTFFVRWQRGVVAANITDANETLWLVAQ
jgi:hypothetical protein